MTEQLKSDVFVDMVGSQDETNLMLTFTAQEGKRYAFAYNADTDYAVTGHHQMVDMYRQFVKQEKVLPVHIVFEYKSSEGWKVYDPRHFVKRE